MAAGGPWRSAASVLRLIRFSHTLFALPWAIGGLFLGAGGWPAWRTLVWVLVAMVGARTAAMTFNRLADRRLDATNARTRDRPSVTGAVGVRAMGAMTAGASFVFVCAAYQLNVLCGHLAWPTLTLLLGYSYCKRFTSLSHLILGLSLGLSPVGAFLATRGAFDDGWASACALGMAVVAWTTGFDILYACQDVEHDQREGLFSLPARLGVKRALRVARGCHLLVPVALGMAWSLASLGLIFLISAGIVCALLVYEHRLVRAEDLSRVGLAFFNVNVVIGFTVMLGIVLDVLLLSGRS